MEYNKKAIWAMIFSVLAIIVIFVVSIFPSDFQAVNPFIFFFYPFSIVGLILGFKSKTEIKVNPQSGRWMAILSIILNIILILLPLIIALLIFIAFMAVEGRVN